MGNACIVAEALQVQDLADPSGAKSDELLKETEVFDGGNLPHIPLYIGLKVIAKGLRRVELPVINPRVETRQKETVQRGRQMAPAKFRYAERQEFEQGRAAGQGLGDGVEDFELLTSRENETSGDALFVHDDLDIGQQMGEMVHFASSIFILYKPGT